MALNYQPTVWERIGGPWAITLRAYLWTAPIAVLFQPLIEPGFWSGKESPVSWLIVCCIGYLAFGLFLFVANKFLIPNRIVKPAPVFVVIVIAVIGGFIRSFVIGETIPLFGLTGIGGIARMPFGAIIAVFWIITSALIMDSKYRYRRQLDELISEQVALIQKEKEFLNNFASSIPLEDKNAFDFANHRIQNVIRDLVTKANDSNSKWEPVARQALQAVMKLIVVQKRNKRFSELAESEFIASPRDAYILISRTPLFSIPVVFTVYVTLIFLAAARILPIDEAFFQLAIGLTVNLMILVISKKAIQRSSSNSSFGYLTMFAVLTLLAIIGPLFSSASYISVFELQVFALAGTVIEIIWIVSTGLLQLSQQNRQKLIDQAIDENQSLRFEIEYWKTIERRCANEQFSPAKTLELIACDLQNFLELDEPTSCQGAIECANAIVGEFKVLRVYIDDFSLDSEFARISSTWGREAEVLWTVDGPAISDSALRKAITVVEICILRSLRNGGATVVSVDLKNTGTDLAITVTDNGQDHENGGSTMVAEALQELSANTWAQARSGGVNKVTAQISQ